MAFLNYNPAASCHPYIGPAMGPGGTVITPPEADPVVEYGTVNNSQGRNDFKWGGTY